MEERISWLIFAGLLYLLMRYGSLSTWKLGFKPYRR
ncbi:MAG: hypothetical protein BMS9Abin36_0824 [Gammaproteobacteria bacterium]|nr:MAG: hypothetical protein BMS9Abin36_0824 [Gammaproteobacteria bacterium]